MEEEKKGNKLTDKHQSEIYNNLLKNEKDKVKKLLFENRTRTQQEKLQQYYTPDALAVRLMDESGIKNEKQKIRILEPTAGDGALIRPLMGLKNIDFHIDLIELDLDNRKTLTKTIDGKNCITLQNHRNFLTYTSPGIYDYIFMNPPFHLRKGENSTMLRDTYDFDFVRRAYAMLRVGGVLMAIIGRS